MITTQQAHKKLVSNTFKKIDGRGNKMELLHAIMGIAGEVGELVDAIKKHIFYEKQLDITNVVEELGDIEYYLEALRQNLILSREDILHQNIYKLEKRYPNQVYSNKAATERADKIPRLTGDTYYCHNCEKTGNRVQIKVTEGGTGKCDICGFVTVVKTPPLLSVKHHEPGSPEWYEFLQLRGEGKV